MGSSKRRVQIWKRALVHFLASFFIGAMIGFIPFGALVPVEYVKRDFALGVKTIPTNVEQDFSQVGNRGRLIETIRTDIEDAIIIDDDVEENSTEENSTENLLDYSSTLSEPWKLVIIVTITNKHPLQAMRLTRLAHTLKLVEPPLLWILVEAPAPTMETAELLRNTGVMYRHLACDKNGSSVRDLRNNQRDAALSHIEKHMLDGIVYYADENNVYSLELFQQLREIKRLGVWPVARIAENKRKVVLEGPVCNSTEIVGWNVEDKGRLFYRFYTNHAGYAFNSTILWDPKRWRRPSVEPLRHSESARNASKGLTFIEQLVAEESQMEGLGHGCSEILVWNIQMETLSFPYPSKWTVERNLESSISLTEHI